MLREQFLEILGGNALLAGRTQHVLDVTMARLWLGR
jgi:hypothetical protein